MCGGGGGNVGVFVEFVWFGGDVWIGLFVCGVVGGGLGLILVVVVVNGGVLVWFVFVWLMCGIECYVVGIIDFLEGIEYVWVVCVY